MQIDNPLLILVAGPYRSGTNDNPHLIEANVKAMTDTALELYRMGHINLSLMNMITKKSGPILSRT